MCNSLLGFPSIFELLDHMFVKICAAQNNQLGKALNVNKKKKFTPKNNMLVISSYPLHPKQRRNSMHAKTNEKIYSNPHFLKNLKLNCKDCYLSQHLKLLH